jgi:hypothetical protein
MGAFFGRFRQMNHMKTIASILAIFIGLVVASTRADTASDRDFTTRLVEIFRDCQKVKPGMTRAEFVKLAMFDEDTGPLHVVNDSAFRQHTTFEYRANTLIKIDVDFSPSDSTEARPTDVIAKVSLPFIDARARR